MAAAERRLSPWFGTEVTFLLLVTAALLLLEVGRGWSIAVIFAAWALVAAVELAVGRRGTPVVVLAEPEEPEVERRPAPAAVAGEPPPPPEPEPDAEPEPEPEPAGAAAEPEWRPWVLERRAVDARDESADGEEVRP